MTAGTSKIKNFLFVDAETFYDSDYSLRKMSPPEYILDSRFELQLLAVYDIKWNAPRIVLPEDLPDFLASYPPEETACCSHNALFDLSILSWRYNWVAGRLVDTLGMARGLRSYKKYALGSVLKELFGADTKGDTLHKVRGMHAQDIKRAGLWPDFQTYALNDVLSCARIYAKLAPEFPIEERRVMDLVLRAAVCPTIQANVPLLETHLLELRKAKADLLVRCGYDKAALMSSAHFRKALEDLGVEVKTKPSPTNPEKYLPQFSKTDPFMADLAGYAASPDEKVNFQVQTLAAARLSHKSTIEETRCERFVNIARLPWGNAHLLPVALRYGGAHTHRLSGEWKLNMQNLPRDKTRSQLRKALVAPKGFKIITADLAQIEARIVAQICGQNDLVELFRLGEDVYARFASLIFGRAITKKDHPNERFIGKTAILGLGYGCGHHRFYTMVTTGARQNGIPLQGLFDEQVALNTVETYRQTWSRIQATWYYLDRQLDRCIRNDREQENWKPIPLAVTFMPGRIRLPNGMFLRYTGDTSHLYGAKLLENITQALARIVVMQSAVRLADKGLRFVLQAHDELCFVVLDAFVEDAKLIIAEEMVREPTWLPGLPLAVELGVGQNYGEAK